MNRFPELKTETLMLREFQKADAQAVYEIFSQNRVTASATINSEEIR